MRFFSNEAKENEGDREAADNDTDGDRAGADGVAVPQQRIGSPWSDAPGSDTAEAEPVEAQAHDDREETRDADTDLRDESLRQDDSEVRHDGDDLVRDDDSPRHDDPLDLPLDDQDAVDNHPGSHRADGGDTPVDEAHVDDSPGAEQRGATTTTYGPDGSMTTVDDDATSTDTTPVSSEAETETPTDTADERADLNGTAPVGATGSEISETDTSETAASDTAVSDTTVSDPAFSDTTTSDTATSDTATSDTAASETAASGTADGEPVAATGTESVADAEVAPAVPVGAADAATAAKPDPSASPVGDRLFADGDSFNDRLRDITLNFVDNPKEATEQAAALVDEAIDQVTSALKAQKDALSGEGDDTEKYRVELRGYREILKRISSL